MYHINGWTCMDTFEKELEAGVTVMPEVETVFYQYIDRGVDITEFSTYIERKYPNIKDLWLSQNFFSITIVKASCCLISITNSSFVHW